MKPSVSEQVNFRSVSFPKEEILFERNFNPIRKKLKIMLRTRQHIHSPSVTIEIVNSIVHPPATKTAFCTKVQIALKTPWDFFGSAGFLAFGELFSKKIGGSNYFDIVSSYRVCGFFVVSV